VHRIVDSLRDKGLICARRRKRETALPYPIHHCLLLIAATAVVAGATACAQTPAPNEQVKATDFEAAISRLQKNDPQSPETLNARLEYADFLLGQTGDDCQQRSAAAQAQLDIVAARPAIGIVLPLAPAQIADGEYKIHLARATCGGQPPLKSELQQALEAAQRAAELHRDALDYQSAAIMQFNVAATDQQLGDVNAAVSALGAAVAMDREYGFRKDAEDNTKLLLQWKDQKADDSDVAAAMKDFPARTADFKFGWSDSDADVALDTEDTSVIQGKVIQSRHAVTLTRQIREGSEGWVVTNEAGNSSYNLGDWPARANAPQWPVLYFLASSLLWAPDIEVSRDGDFKSVRFAEAFGASLAAQVSAEISSRTSTPSRVLYSSLGQQVMGDPSLAFAPDFIESKAAQDYGLQTATWIGAKLEQGVWYQMSTPLFLPGLGLGHYLVQHDVSFAFTRELPCMTGSDRLCAEIVIHAAPDTNDLKSALKDADPGLRLPDNQPPQVWSRTDIRLVVDSTTLLPTIFDTRQTWYDGLGKSDPIIESIRTVSTSVYQKQP
jgi:tetratricopeptide (TPR) repeat protein